MSFYLSSIDVQMNALLKQLCESIILFLIWMLLMNSHSSTYEAAKIVTLKKLNAYFSQDEQKIKA